MGAAPFIWAWSKVRLVWMRIRPEIKSMICPFRLIPCLLASVVPALAQPLSKSGAPAFPEPPAEPKYKQESPLPKGWPEPGPYNQVVLKKYPAYRAAFTADPGPNGGFMRLFKHITKNDIPMSAPVAMKLDETDTQSVKMEEMAFIYQSPEVGNTGKDGDRVEVRDVPAQEALSYAWMGSREAVAKARALIDAELEKRKLTASGYRLLGYNSPFVPRSKQTHELQALIK